LILSVANNIQDLAEVTIKANEGMEGKVLSGWASELADDAGILRGIRRQLMKEI
jgi:hypothetical protein